LISNSSSYIGSSSVLNLVLIVLLRLNLARCNLWGSNGPTTDKKLVSRVYLTAPKSGKRSLTYLSSSLWKIEKVEHCNTPSNPCTSGTYSWQLSMIIYRPHRSTRVFCAHFVLTHAHLEKLPGRSPIPNCSKPSTLNLQVISRQAFEK
jgi:hypothetical protein